MKRENKICTLCIDHFWFSYHTDGMSRTPCMNHLHTYLYLEKDGVIQVSLDSPGNVYLLTDTEYTKYKQGSEFKGYGGLVKARKKNINAPGEGKWHLVVDNNNQQESLNVALNISRGRQLPETDSAEIPTSPEQQECYPEEISQEKNQGKNSKDRKEFLTKEITKRLKELNEDDLRFLMNQAKILVHNQEGEKLHQEIMQEEIQHETDDYVVSAKPREPKNPSTRKTLVGLEEQSENTFILIVCGARKVLSRLELREIVKMCHAQMSDTAFSVQLFEWLKIHRNDILFDARIRTADHPVWPALRRFLRKRYKLKK
jgi:hypothetical protein